MASKGVTITMKDLGLAEVTNYIDTLREGMAMIGETCVNEARSKEKQDDWTDQTGNLRSSIGYTLVDGKETIVEANPQAVSGPRGNGTQGVSQAKSLLARLRSNTPQGVLKLIVVAGMDYASEVQARGRNVTMSAYLKAETMVSQMFKR